MIGCPRSILSLVFRSEVCPAASQGINFWEFTVVLATSRRNGKPLLRRQPEICGMSPETG